MLGDRRPPVSPWSTHPGNPFRLRKAPTQRSGHEPVRFTAVRSGLRRTYLGSAPPQPQCLRSDLGAEAVLPRGRTCAKMDRPPKQLAIGSLPIPLHTAARLNLPLEGLVPRSPLREDGLCRRRASSPHWGGVQLGGSEAPLRIQPPCHACATSTGRTRRASWHHAASEANAPRICATHRSRYGCPDRPIRSAADSMSGVGGCCAGSAAMLLHGVFGECHHRRHGGRT